MLQYTKENTKGKEMKYIQNITTLLLAMTLALLLSACNTKTSQDENNTAGSSSPTTQTTEDTSATGSSGSSNAADGSNNTTSGTDDNTTTGGGDDNTTTTPTVTLKSLNLTVGKTTLNKDENTTVKVMATYSDNSRKEVTDKVEWVVVPSDAVKMTNATLVALQDKATTFKAKLKGKTSNAITLNIIWVVNGHTLPPEPDPAVNNSTLLGVDVNNNGVRDDVERWIYKTYKDKHPIHIDIAMQAGRAYSQLLKSPLKNVSQAKIMHKKCVAPIACKAYYQIYAKYFNEPLLVTEDIDIGYFQKFYFNTPRRRELYNKYSRLLSGGMYSTPKLGEGKNFCDFNVSAYKD